MLNECQLDLLKELAMKPRTKREQHAFSSMHSLRATAFLFAEHGILTVSENSDREKVLTITDKGREMLRLCEQLVKLGVVFR